MAHKSRTAPFLLRARAQRAAKIKAFKPRNIVKDFTGGGIVPSGPAYAYDSLNQILSAVLALKDLAIVFYTQTLTSGPVLAGLTQTQVDTLTAVLWVEATHRKLLAMKLGGLANDPYSTFYLPGGIFTAAPTTIAGPDVTDSDDFYTYLAEGGFIDFLGGLESLLVSAENTAVGEINALAWNSGLHASKFPVLPTNLSYAGAAELFASLGAADLEHQQVAQDLYTAYEQIVYPADDYEYYVSDEEDYENVFYSLVAPSDAPLTPVLAPFIGPVSGISYFDYILDSQATFSNSGWTAYYLSNALATAQSLFSAYLLAHPGYSFPSDGESFF